MQNVDVIADTEGILNCGLTLNSSKRITNYLIDQSENVHVHG